MLGINRRAAKRDEAEKPIVDTLRVRGWTVDYLSAPDLPDLLLSKQGYARLAEVKTGKKKLKPGQADWHARWQGEPVEIFRTVDDAIAFDRALFVDDPYRK